jgi:cell wall-associated NlpC family hydrolase
VSGRFVASAAAAGALLAVAGHHAGAGAQAKPGNPAAQAIAYAQAQLGKPYLWGATGPGAFDCSGLVMQAYAAARVRIARTSQAQWATEQQVSAPELGDLVFFPGADGTPASPGHVGIVIDPARNLMIDAYASGLPVEYDTYGPGASKQGLRDPVGFTDPARGS